MRTFRFLTATLGLLAGLSAVNAQTVFSENFQYADPNNPATFQFTSTYTFVNNTVVNGMNPASVYSVTPNLARNLGNNLTQHLALAADDQPGGHSFYDHTFGNAEGLYMAVNGGSATSVYSTIDPIAVTPNTDYTFSIWLNSWTNAGNNFGQLDVLINGNSIGTVTAPEVTDYATWGIPWTERILTFNSGNNTSITLDLINLTTDPNGNDYEIDDIRIFAVPEPGALAMGGLGLLGLGGMVYRNIQQRRRRKATAKTA